MNDREKRPCQSEQSDARIDPDIDTAPESAETRAEQGRPSRSFSDTVGIHSGLKTFLEMNRDKGEIIVYDAKTGSVMYELKVSFSGHAETHGQGGTG